MLYVSAARVGQNCAEMPKTGAYPVTLSQRLQTRPLCRWAPDLGVPFGAGADDTNQLCRLRPRTSPSQPDDWLAAVNVELIQIHSNGIYIPRLEYVVIIQNVFDAWY